MRKRIIAQDTKQDHRAQGARWLNIPDFAVAELTSEDFQYPIEGALVATAESSGRTRGFRAAGPGEQKIRLIFDTPQSITRIRLTFDETQVARTQEHWLTASSDGGRSFKELFRQQWNFSPDGSTLCCNEHVVAIAQVDVLELCITPDISGGGAIASLAEFWVA